MRYDWDKCVTSQNWNVVPDGNLKYFYLTDWTQFTWTSKSMPKISDCCNWSGIINALIWGTYYKISRCCFWDMAPLTPLFWPKLSFFDRIQLVDWNNATNKYSFIFVMFCLSIIPKWALKWIATLKKFQKKLNA